jgi:hypothetical protein
VCSSDLVTRDPVVPIFTAPIAPAEMIVLPIPAPWRVIFATDMVTPEVQVQPVPGTVTISPLLVAWSIAA